MKNKIVYILWFLILTSCFSKQSLVDAQEHNPFFAYNFGKGLLELSAKGQVEALSSYGFKGITFQIDDKDVDNNNVYDQIEHMNAVIEESKKLQDFSLISVFFRYNFELPQDFLTQGWKDVIDIIANKSPKTNFWIIFGTLGKNKQYDYSYVDDAFVEGELLKMVKYAKSKGVNTTLYPHSNTFYTSAEQIIPVVNRINGLIGEPYLKIAIHLCHELRAGNENRMGEVVKNVGDLLSYVSISGADVVPDRSSNLSVLFASTLRPLYQDPGYNIGPFLKALKQARFKGPVGMINFKLDNSIDDYLPKSMAKWQALKAQYLDY